MRLHEDVYILPMARPGGDAASALNLTLILDDEHGPALVDTGLPGQFDAINSALEEAGTSAAQLTRIILTHHDIDHIGSLPQLVAASGAEVLASTVETPFIDGRATPRFATPEALAQNPQLRAVAGGFQPTPVGVLLEDGTELDLAGGVRVVFTPGHTPGHVCLYLERSRTLIAGDALTAEAGQLRGPNERATQDMAEAARSVAKLAALDVDMIVCYHGGVVSDDASAQLRRVAGEMGV